MESRSGMSDYGFGAVPNELLDRKDARIVELEAALEHALSWEGLLEFIDDTYPPHIFTGESGDPGPSFIVLLRELKQAEAALAERRESWEATIERLKCCGNCEHFGSGSQYEFDPTCFAGQWGEEYESLGGGRGTIKTSVTDYHHHCHFTPSRWTTREE